MNLVICDTETTGLGPEDQVVEIALVTDAHKWSSLVRPSCPVSSEARAAHHILDAELAEAPTMSELVHSGALRSLTEPETVLVAHNAQFDRRMLSQCGVPTTDRVICTHRCSLHLFPQAPRHSNQVLRYWLDLLVPSLMDIPHRALPDALVTRALLYRMLMECTAERLMELSGAPVLLDKVAFGKYRGSRWSELDVGYLNFVLNKANFGVDERFTARHWLDRRRGV